MHKSQTILTEVQKTYNVIAGEFSQTRQYIGKEFELFKPYLKPPYLRSPSDILPLIIVDVGCGNGRLLYFLKNIFTQEKYRQYTGIDNSKNLLKEAKKLHPASTFTFGDMLDIPLPDNQADVIFNLRAFHHLPSKQLQLQGLKEMQRILKPGGILILTVWNLWQRKNWKELMKAAIRSIITLGKYSWQDTHIPWNNKELRYYYAFTQKSLYWLIGQSGFEIIQFISSKEQKKYGIRDYVVIARKKDGKKETMVQ